MFGANTEFCNSGGAGKDLRTALTTKPVRPTGMHVTMTGEETATNHFYCFAARWYDAGVGRFVSRSPLGPPVEHFYVFCANDPVDYLDTNGLIGSWWELPFEEMDEGFEIMWDWLIKAIGQHLGGWGSGPHAQCWADCVRCRCGKGLVGTVLDYPAGLLGGAARAIPKKTLRVPYHHGGGYNDCSTYLSKLAHKWPRLGWLRSVGRALSWLGPTITLGEGGFAWLCMAECAVDCTDGEWGEDKSDNYLECWFKHNRDQYYIWMGP